MLKKIVAIVTLAVGVVTSAFVGTAPATAIEFQEPIVMVASVGADVPGDDGPSTCRHSWKKCDVLPGVPTVSGTATDW